MSKVFRVMSEYYDKSWYVKTTNEDRALKLVKDMTEKLGWHLSFPEDERDFDVEEVFVKEGQVWEDRDL